MKKVQVLGPFNSGTNLLIKMLVNNCIEIEKPGDKVVVCENILMWKHTLRHQFIRKRALESKNHVFIIVYKNIYNWLFSVAISPYDIQIPKGLFGKLKMMNLEYNNIVDLHNHYCSMHKKLLEEFPDQIVAIDYFKLIQKEGLIDYLKPKLEKIGLKLKDEKNVVEKLDRPCKFENTVKNSNQALDKYHLVQEMMKSTIASHPDIAKCINFELMDYFENL